MGAQLLQSCPTLCDPMDCSPPGSSVHGILQARILVWVAMPSSRGYFRPRYQTCISCIFCIAGGFFSTEPPGKPCFIICGHSCSSVGMNILKHKVLSRIGACHIEVENILKPLTLLSQHPISVYKEPTYWVVT